MQILYIILYILQTGESMLLGNLQKGSLDVMGAVVEIISMPRPRLEWILRIQNPNMCTPFEVAVETRDEVC